MSEGDVSVTQERVSVTQERPLKQSRETWNRILARYQDDLMPEAVNRFIHACLANGDPIALTVAADLELRLAISRKLGFKPWPPAAE